MGGDSQIMARHAQLTFGFLTEDFSALDVSWDNSLLFSVELLRRGHRVVFMTWKSLRLDNGGATATFFESRYAGSGRPEEHFSDLGRRSLSELDLCLLRLDPPVDERYLAATYMLEYAGTRVLNDPATIRRYNEKISIFSYPQGIRTTCIVLSEEAALDAILSHARIKRWVAKPTNAFGGIGVESFESRQLDEAVRLMRKTSNDWKSPIVLQEFNERVSEGDKRIFLLEGRPIGWVNRIPKPGQFLANIHAGAITVPFDLSEGDLKICEHIAATFPSRELPLICIDVIGEHLSEINVTCPSGLIQINRAMKKSCELEIIDCLEARAREE